MLQLQKYTWLIDTIRKAGKIFFRGDFQPLGAQQRLE